MYYVRLLANDSTDSTSPEIVQAVVERLDALIYQYYQANAQNSYTVPYKAVTSELAATHAITAPWLYGGIVTDTRQADKGMLHPLAHPNADYPGWYMPELAVSMTSYTLRGFTAFDANSLTKAFEALQQSGYTVRHKNPALKGGRGQYVLHERNSLQFVIDASKQIISQTGVVLEAQLENSDVVTVGILQFMGSTYTSLGRPFEIAHGATKAYGGSRLRLVKGGFDTLLGACTSTEESIAVSQAASVLTAYQSSGISIGRAVVDVVQGAANGSWTSGVTDPSLRPSGSSPAEVRALEELLANPAAWIASVQLDYSYGPTPARHASQEEFLVLPGLTLLVEVLEVR